MQGWIKHFSDGKSEVGSDALVAARKASFTRGRRKDIVSMDLHAGKYIFTLSLGQGEYWQSDTWITKFSGMGRTTRSTAVVRRISRKISESDILEHPYLNYAMYDNCWKAWFSKDKPPEEIDCQSMILGSKDINKWILLTVSTDSYTPRLSIEDQKK